MQKDVEYTKLILKLIIMQKDVEYTKLFLKLINIQKDVESTLLRVSDLSLKYYQAADLQYRPYFKR